MHCIGLVFLAVWGLCLSSEWSSSCNNNLRTVCVGVSDPVFVPCPSLDSEDLRFKLFKNQEMMSLSICNQSDPCQQRSPVPFVSWTNQSTQLGFTLTVQNQSSHGLYRCEGKSMFPPPVQTKSGPEQVLVLVQGDQCKFSVSDPGSSSDPNPVWIIALVFSCIYSLFVSVIAVVLWMKRRSAEYQNDYVNTRPPRNQRHRRAKAIHSFTRV